MKTKRLKFKPIFFGMIWCYKCVHHSEECKDCEIVKPTHYKKAKS